MKDQQSLSNLGIASEHPSTPLRSAQDAPRNDGLRFVALLALLIVVGGATFFIAYARPTPAPPTPIAASTATPLHSYLIDVAGWYEITPNESAVASPFDLSIEGLKALPETLGRWSGMPNSYGAAVDEWFEKPDLGLSSIYRDDQGIMVWYSMFGSRGRKSYSLFEHTPATSYPAAGWTLVDNHVAQIPMNPDKISVNQVTLTKGGERRIVFFWYLWPSFDRDPEKGVITVRLHVPVTSTDEAAIQVGADFLRALFPQVITWRRF